MKLLKKHKQTVILSVLLFGAAVLRLWAIQHIEIQHDHAINSFRALGWLDYLTGVGQTTPIIWFGKIPWWALLSFHDHPPLSFAIQHIFFVLFGDTDIAAILPFILSGIVSTALLYFTFHKINKQQVGLWILGIYSITSYAIWISRTGYLEGMLTLWIVLSFFFLVRYAYTNNTINLLFWCIAIALAVMTKYTSIFLIPAGALYILLYNRKHLFSKHLWIGVASFLVILTPIIIYNIMLFKTRGHFDAALSSMVGMQPEDYATLAYRSVDSNFFSNGATILKTLWHNTSASLIILYALSFLYALTRVFKKQAGRIEIIALLHLAFLATMFLFTETSSRFFAISVPFLSVLTGFTLFQVVQMIRVQQTKLIFASTIITIFLCGELFYAINTNLLPEPVLAAPLFYATDRQYERGFKELDAYLRKNVITDLPKRLRIREFTDDIASVPINDRDIILYDERLDWFARMWYERRYVVYYDISFIYFYELEVAHAASGYPGTALEYLKKGGANKFWVVVSAKKEEQSLKDKPGYQQYTEKVDEMVKSFEENNIEPYIISDPTGEPSIYVYTFDINPPSQ